MEELKAYIQETLPELRELIVELCGIPAPSHHEEKRAEFCRDWLLRNGASPEQVHIDEALNVVCEVPGETDEVIVFMAHTDTVFPDLEPLPMEEKDGILHCPGVGDDTANAAILLLLARYIAQKHLQPKDGFLLVCDTGEEALGNLKGIKQIMQDYAGRIKEAYIYDGLYGQAVNWPVAVIRYRVKVGGQGGHAYLNFGNPSAVVCAASMINEIYALPLPEGCKSSYNVGLISGGTTVNAIPQTVDMAVELRSEIEANLNTLRGQFREIVEKYRKQGTYEIQVEDDGSLPGKGDVDEARQGRINEKIRAIFGEYLEGDTIFRSGAGDLNIPASRVPGVGVCAYKLGRIHSREEYIDLNSLENALRASLAVVLSCVND